MRFDAVLFDCDGVLINSESIAQDTEIKALAKIGLDYDRPEFVRRFMGKTDIQFFSELKQEYSDRGLGVLDDQYLLDCSSSGFLEQIVA